MALGPNKKFGAIEILFALGILAAGIIGLAFSFKLGAAPQPTFADDDTTTPSTEATALYQRVITEPDPANPGKPLYMARIVAGKEWIQSDANTPEPVRIAPNSNLFWSCRVSKNAMDQIELKKDAVPVHTYPEGQYQLAIFVYRNVQPGVQTVPSAMFTSVVSMTPPKDQDQSKTDTATSIESRLPDPEADYKRLRSKN